MKTIIGFLLMGFITLSACQQTASGTSTTTDTSTALPAVSASAGAAAVPPATSVNWSGHYTTYFSYGKIAGQNAGWQLDIHISPDSLTATGEGFQLYFKDQLRSSATPNKLTLRYVKTVEGSALGKTMNPEFTLVHNNGKFYVQSKWISADVVDKPTANGYLMDKK